MEHRSGQPDTLPALMATPEPSPQTRRRSGVSSASQPVAAPPPRPASSGARAQPAPSARPARQAPTGPPVIEFRGVSKLYPSGDVGLDQATFSIVRGEFVFLVGSTGSGKSTVMRLLIKE